MRICVLTVTQNMNIEHQRVDFKWPADHYFMHSTNKYVVISLVISIISSFFTKFLLILYVNKC